MKETYTKESIHTLTKIRENLVSSLKKATIENEKLNSRIQIYKSIGFGFEQLANEYSSILEQIQVLQWKIKELETGK